MQQPVKLDVETAALVAGAMPATMRELIGLIGLESALALVGEFGGTSYVFPKDINGPAADRFEYLVEIVGPDAAHKLASHPFVQEKVYIPICSKALRLLRNRQVIAAYDCYLRNGSTRYARRQVAREFGISDRWVDRVVNGKTTANTASEA